MFLAFIKKNVPCRPYAPAHQKWSVPRKIGTRWLVYNLKCEQEVRRLLDSARLLAVADKTVTATNKSMVFRYMMKEPSDSFLFGWILHRSNSGGLYSTLHSPGGRITITIHLGALICLVPRKRKAKWMEGLKEEARHTCSCSCSVLCGVWASCLFFLTAHSSDSI
jgi:hypothetical protein